MDWTQWCKIAWNLHRKNVQPKARSLSLGPEGIEDDASQIFSYLWVELWKQGSCMCSQDFQWNFFRALWWSWFAPGEANPLCYFPSDCTLLWLHIEMAFSAELLSSVTSLLLSIILFWGVQNSFKCLPADMLDWREECKNLPNKFLVTAVSIGRGYYVSGKNTANLKGCIEKVTLKTFIKRQDLDAALPLGRALHFSRRPHRFQWESVEWCLFNQSIRTW